MIITATGDADAARINVALQNTTLRTTIEKVAPEEKALREQAQRLVTEAGSILPPNSVDPAKALREALAARKPLPDLLALFGDDDDAARRFARTQSALTVVLNQIHAERLAIAVAHADAIMEDLSARAAAVVTAYRENPARTCHDLEEALELDMVNQWRELKELERTFTALFDAHAAAARHFTGGIMYGTMRQNPVLSVLANPAEVWDEWPSFAKTGRNADGRMVEAPWPDPDDRVAFLRWLADTPEAVVWTPTEDQLDAAVRQLNTQAREQQEEKEAEKRARRAAARAGNAPTVVTPRRAR